MSTVHADFYDPVVNDKQWVFDYLDTIEEAVGQEAFEAVPYARALKLAGTLGPIDRVGMTAEIFLAHLRHVGEVEGNFYKKAPLDEEMVMAYLMPLRMRYESTSQPGWAPVIKAHLEEATAGAVTADECAWKIFTWMTANLTLTGSPIAYRLPMRGDLDPLTVLKGGRGSEIDLAIFGVAALRCCGVAARLVWAPALRGEIGGKVWLEYLSEAGAWSPWVPSLGSAGEDLSRFRKEYGSKIALVMASPEKSIEVTSAYVDTVKVRISTVQEDTEVAFLILGSEGLMALRGTAAEYARNERDAVIGRGSLIVAATSNKRHRFVLLPLEMPDGAEEIIIRAADGLLSIEPNKETTNSLLENQ